MAYSNRTPRVHGHPRRDFKSNLRLLDTLRVRHNTDDFEHLFLLHHRVTSKADVCVQIRVHLVEPTVERLWE